MLFARYSSHKRMIPPYLVLGLSAAFSIYTIALVIGHEMDYISYLLYDRSYLSAVSNMLSQFVVKKILFCAIVLFMVLLSLFLYYFSCHMPIYLELATVCFLSIIYCESLLEKNTLFYIGTSEAHLWYFINFSSLLFLSYLLFFITFEPQFQNLIPKYCSSSLLMGLLVFISIYFFTHSTKQNQSVLFTALSVLLLLNVLLLFQLLYRKDFHSILKVIPISAWHVLLFWFNYEYLCLNDSVAQIQKGEALYSMTLYFTFGLIIYLYIMVFNRQKIFLNSRDTNRKIQEVENSKHVFSTVVCAGVKNHTKAIRSLIQETDSLQSTEICQELSSIEMLFFKINNYNLFNKDQLDIRLTTIETGIFWKFIQEFLSRNHILNSQDTCHIDHNPGYIYIAVERLIQSIYDIIYTLKDNFPDVPLSITCFRKEGNIHIEFNLQNSPQIHKVLQTMAAYSIFSSSANVESLDYAVSTCRYVISLSNGKTRLLLKNGIRIAIELPVFSDYAPDYREYHVSDNSPLPKEQLLFISSDYRQEQELLRLLPKKRYSITVCNDASHYYKNPLALRDYSLIIIGNLYHSVFYNDFLIEIRQYFSMTELPVLLILPSLLSETEIYVHSNINDFLAPPVSKTTLELKIKSLLSMKRTADIASEAKLEFLQSQMNPHFIFNSINSIMQFCIESPMTAYKLLEDFSEYLRGHLFSLSLNRISTIQRETDLITAYLEIEKARFGDHVNYRLNIDCDENFPILPLLIEPLVENSIKHSSMHEKAVTITVDIFQERDSLHVTVTDNGNGMTAEMIESILSYTSINRSIGLYNVCNRLKYYYHTTPQIESELGQGTSISFFLAKNIHMHNLEDET